MKRRSFLKKSSLLTAGTLFTPLFLQQTLGQIQEEYKGKKIVIIQFSGGNDGLNTVIPYLDDNYYKARPSIAIQKEDLIQLDNNLGINGQMKGFADLFHKGYVSVINNVGYPNPNRSHFRSMDIWHTASDANQYLNTGWLGRYMDAHCSKPREGIELDNTLSLAMKGSQIKGIAVDNPYTFYNTLKVGQFDTLASGEAENLNEDNQGYLYKTLTEANQSAEYIFEHSKVYKSKTTFPDTALGKNLKSIAELIQSGMDSKVYYASLGGFDTHAGQIPQQSKLLKQYSEGVSAFVEELEKTDHFKDTVIMTFSEFGRRVKQNASKGTDHGAANNVFIIGKNLKKEGIINENPDLVNLNRGDLIHSVDFRSIYADLLNNWLNVSSSEIMSKNINELSLI
ncbi:DUF1501 domain-containing protein [Flammeovirga pectinis]|uniref:DUF1501 domain-containing protein n=1 Tax=Flammeovirga pectinis TaxID=2494373 RepID=A0A3Q9FQX5_9BACT|nr:DUF1501 domain-containing protein [Flammeovirga pectinis]AZQ62652.1 DUF1501 domain-containing protein [Flammeovirga pectinis]